MPRMHGTLDRSGIAALACVVALLGCGRTSAPPATIAKSAPAAKSPVEASPAVVVAPHARPPAADEVKDALVESDNVADTSASDATPVAPERFVLLTAGGPLVVHVKVTIDGQPQREAAEQVLADVLKSAVEGEAADVSWSSLVENPKVVTGQLGNMPLADTAARTRAARDFDANNDQRVQPGELAAFLSRDAGGGQASSVRWLADRMAGERWNSPVFVLLDANQDGRLSVEECAAAPVRLRSRDVDDNDAVTIADFRPPELPMQMTNYRSEPAPSRGFALERYSLDSIYYTLCELYNADYGLEAEQFETAPDLFSALDVDGSERVEQREIAGLLDARPDLLLRVDYSAGAPPRLTLEKLSDALIAAGAHADESPARLVVALAGCQFDLVAVDAAQRGGRLAEARSMFAKLDANGDKVLDADELAKSAPPVTAEVAKFDSDGDGKLTFEELERELAGQPNYRDRQLHVLLAEPSDPLLGWLDERPDGRLTSRELSGAAERLAQLDANHDGVIGANELPDRLSCVMQLGGAVDNRASTLPLPPAPLTVQQEVPGWLSAMDQNGDGEISRREFVGTPEQFQRFDGNADGFLDAEEALAAEPRAAPADAEAKPLSTGP
ncbi:MAG: hypothetical protein WD845_14795 [Pirellulales bacterium]